MKYNRIFSVLSLMIAATTLLAPTSTSAARRASKAKQPATTQPATSQPAIDAGMERDVVYSHNGGVDLHLDLYFPKTKSEHAAPLAIFVHGGAWRSGNKRTGFWLTDIKNELNSRGYVVASLDYRMVPDFKWPAFIYDCKAAVRFLRANAAKYNIDPNHVGAWGTSAGGHLVALMGTTDPSDKLEGDGGNAEQSSRLQAVVDLFGPMDLVKSRRPDIDQIAEDAFGGMEGRKVGSPVRYVTKDDPPFLLIQGDADVRIPVDQSQSMLDLLHAAGVEATFTLVKNGTHGLSSKDISPTRAVLVKEVCDFFDKHLKRNE